MIGGNGAARRLIDRAASCCPPGARGWLLGLLALTVLRLVVAALIPLLPDEAYYWVWSRALAGGYPDHPPMVALWIRAGTALAGNGALGVRLLAPLSAALGSLMLARAAEDILPGRGAGVRAAVLLNATLLLGVGAVTMTPDTPQIFFWTATIWALGRVLATGHARWWLVAGLACGATLVSKYTGFLLLGGVFLWLLAHPTGRAWLRTIWPWLAALLALVLFAPVLEWNAAHGWVSFVRQGGRVFSWQPARAAQFLGELIGGQLGLATPIIFWLCLRGMVWAGKLGWRERAQESAAGPLLLVALTLPGAAVFLQHALGARVQGNWPSILYPAAVIAAAALPGRAWRGGAALGAVLTLVVYLQAAIGIFPLPARLDPSLRQLAGWPALARAAQTRALAGHDSFLAADAYGLASEMAHAAPGLPVLVSGGRWRYFALPSALPRFAGQSGLLLRTAHRQGPPDPAFWQSAVPVGVLERRRGDLVAGRYLLWRVVPRAPIPPRPAVHGIPPAGSGLVRLPNG